MPAEAAGTATAPVAAPADPIARIVHAKWRGAFGLSFFFHHAVVLVRESAENNRVDPEAPAIGPFDASRTTCVHWSAGGQNGDGPVMALDSAVICEVPWSNFVRGGIDGNRHYGGVELEQYPAEVLAASPLDVIYERTRRFLGHQGVFVGVDRDGNTVDGYNPLSWNCEHFAVWCMTGVARSLQSERVIAAAGSVVSVVRSIASGPEGQSSNGRRVTGGGSRSNGGAMELAVGLLNLGVGAFGIFRSFQATADIRADIAELRSVVAASASPDAVLSTIETAMADQTFRLEMAVAAAAASSGRGAAEETARRERVEFRQRCTELCSHYRRLATAAAASAGSGGAAPAQALVSPVLVSASAVRAAAAARLVEAPAGAAVASADLVDGQATEWDVRAAHCSAACFAARAEADAVAVLGLPPAAAVEPLEATLELVRSEAARMLESGGPAGARWAVLEQLLALHQGLRIEAEVAARIADGGSAGPPASAAAAAASSGEAAPARLRAPGLPTRVQDLLRQPLANATAAVAAAAEAAQAPGPLPRRVAAERRAVEAALPGVLSYVSSALEAEFLPEASWGLAGGGAHATGGQRPAAAAAAAAAAASGPRPWPLLDAGVALRPRASASASSASVSGAGATSDSGDAADPEPFVQILSDDASAGGQSLGYLCGFLRENAPRYPHLVSATPAERRGELLSLTAPHDPDWSLLRLLLSGVGGSERWDWAALLPAKALLARGGLGHHLIYGEGARRAAAMAAAAVASARGIRVLPLLSADPSVGPVAALQTLSLMLAEADGGGGGDSGAWGEALLGPEAAAELAGTLPGLWGALAGPSLCDQAVPAAARAERALSLAEMSPEPEAAATAAEAAPGAAGGAGVSSLAFPSPPATAAATSGGGQPSSGPVSASVNGNGNGGWRLSVAVPMGSAASYPSVAVVRSGPTADDPRWSGGRGQRVAVPPALGWPALAVTVSQGGRLDAVPMQLLASLTEAGRALCVEVLTPEGAPFHPHRRWLRVAERRNALPFGLCFGYRLHCEALSDAEAASRLGEPDFRFRFSPAEGAACPGGVRGILTSCVASIKTGRWFGLHHTLKDKYMTAGHCAEMPGTNIEEIHHLAVTPWAPPRRAGGGAGAAGGGEQAQPCVTITLADYTQTPEEEPSDPGYQMRWIDPARWENRDPDRTFPYFACTPFGYRKDCPGGEPGVSKFRFLVVED